MICGLTQKLLGNLTYNDDKAKESIKYFEKAIKLGRKDEWIGQELLIYTLI